jgi:hypothetical protein
MAVEEIENQYRTRAERLTNFFAENPTMLGTTIYVALTVVGLSYSVFFYAQFGIGYLDYAQITDFFVAGLREPIATGLFALTGIVLYGIYRLDFMMRRKFQWYNRVFYRSRKIERFTYHPAMIAIGFLAIALLYTSVYGRVAAQRINDGKGKEVRVKMLAGAQIENTRVLLGTTSTHILLYDSETKMSEVLPVDHVAVIIGEK